MSNAGAELFLNGNLPAPDREDGTHDPRGLALGEGSAQAVLAEQHTAFSLASRHAGTLGLVGNLPPREAAAIMPDTPFIMPAARQAGFSAMEGAMAA